MLNLAHSQFAREIYERVSFNSADFRTENCWQKKKNENWLKLQGITESGPFINFLT